jgi:hypothetical protein
MTGYLVDSLNLRLPRKGGFGIWKVITLYLWRNENADRKKQLVVVRNKCCERLRFF